MGPRPQAGRSAVALVTALSFALTPVAPLMADPAQAPKPVAGPPAPKVTPVPMAAPSAAASPAAAAKPVDGGWPRGYATESGGQVIVYHKKVASWDDQSRMVAFAAVAYMG